MSLLSAIFNTPIAENVSYTGEINGNGYVFNIGGTIAKIQSAEQSGCTKVFIPEGNYRELSKDDLELFSIEIAPVNHVHGHIHNDTESDYWHPLCSNPRILNAGVDVNGFEPVTLEELIRNNEIFKQQHKPNSY